MILDGGPLEAPGPLFDVTVEDRGHFLVRFLNGFKVFLTRFGPVRGVPDPVGPSGDTRGRGGTPVDTDGFKDLKIKKDRFGI